MAGRNACHLYRSGIQPRAGYEEVYCFEPRFDKEQLYASGYWKA
jgi:hypothetical protein